MKQIPFIVALLWSSCLWAQTITKKPVPFIRGNDTLFYNNIGGLNAPQFSNIDLNNDGIKDLYVFDRVGNVSLTFIKDPAAVGTSRFRYAPEYAAAFPDMRNWAILRDYDGDGVMDIFTNPTTLGVPGLEVYKGAFVDNQLQFTKHQAWQGTEDILYFQTTNGLYAGIYVSAIDIPEVIDVDNDGDLDVLTFNPSGGYIEYYRNTSMESGYSRDSLLFSLVDYCWGKFYESGLSEAINLSSSPTMCANGFTTPTAEFRHSGSTVAALDMDNDGDKEVFLGDISFDNITMLVNGGTPQNAYMIAQDTFFPSYNVPTHIPIFPAPFFVDTDDDNKKDYLPAVNNVNSSEDVNVAWRYKNIGTPTVPTFSKVQEDFLTDQCIDLGTGAHPAFVDYNADGLLDLVVGNFSFYKPFGERDARLFLFKNVGTATTPLYELVDDNYLNFAQYSLNSWAFVPCFADMDGDDDMDLLVGEEYGQLFYATNTAGPNAPLQFPTIEYGWKGIDVGQASTPTAFDYNKDGLLDLIIGERFGNLNYFQNIGSPTQPNFLSSEVTLPNTNFLGQVDTRDIGNAAGSSTARFLVYKDTVTLYCGSQLGAIEQYTHLNAANPNAMFTKADEHVANLREGFKTTFDFADVDADSLYEMVIGNFRGGLSFFDTDIPLDGYTVSTAAPLADLTFRIMPTLATQQIRLEFQGVATAAPVQYSIYNTVGNQVLNGTVAAFATVETIGIQHLPAGVYVIHCRAGNAIATQKFIKR